MTRRSRNTGDGPCALPARVLARRLRGKQLTCAEALAAHLERIEKHNPALNAVVSLDTDRARQRAAAADAALQRGEIWGPLHGVPMTLKVAGLRTTLGSAAFDRVADEDGTVAARLRAAGAIIIGHTNVAPLLGDYQSANPIFGRTNNPWNKERTAGGSSGGAAAALAAGMTPLEIGSDLGGSVRLPAHFCGVYGLKTTEHRVPNTGFFRSPDDVPNPVRIMNSLGPMARDLGDLQLALAIIAGPDGRDGDVPPVPLGSPGRNPLKGLRLAVAPTLPGATVATAIQQRVERVGAQVADAGANVIDRLPADLVGTITRIFDPHAHLRDEQRTLAWYLAGLERRDRIAAAWHTYFEDVDVLIVPPAMTTAFTHRDPSAAIDVDGKTVSYWDQGRPLVFANLTGLPGLVVPDGLDEDGLPIGVQLVGPRWSELRLLGIASELERANILPGFQAPPVG